VPVVNLLERFGDRYVVEYTRNGSPARPGDHPFYMGVPCLEDADGHVSYVTANGGDLLRLELEGHRRLVTKLAALPGAERYHLPDGQDLVLFPSAVFDQAAGIVKAVKRHLAVQAA
jgi:hypothetical protein